MGQLLVLQPGPDLVAVVLDLLEHVLQAGEPPRNLAVTAEHATAFGQQLPEPGGQLISASWAAGTGLKLADQAGQQLAGDGDLADRRGRGLPGESLADGPGGRRPGEAAGRGLLHSAQDSGGLFP